MNGNEPKLADGVKLIYLHEDGGRVTDSGVYLAPGEENVAVVGRDVSGELAHAFVERGICGIHAEEIHVEDAIDEKPADEKAEDEKAEDEKAEDEKAEEDKPEEVKSEAALDPAEAQAEHEAEPESSEAEKAEPEHHLEDNAS